MIVKLGVQDIIDAIRTATRTEQEALAAVIFDLPLPPTVKLLFPDLVREVLAVKDKEDE